MPTDTVSQFEQWVLLALVRLKDDAYGRTMHDEIEKRAETSVPIAQVYVTLERMEAKGFVRSRVGDATPTRGGRAKRYFRITGSGESVLRRSLQALDRLRTGVPGFSGARS